MREGRDCQFPCVAFIGLRQPLPPSSAEMNVNFRDSQVFWEVIR